MPYSTNKTMRISYLLFPFFNEGTPQQNICLLTFYTIDACALLKNNKHCIFCFGSARNIVQGEISYPKDRACHVNTFDLFLY